MGGANSTQTQTVNDIRAITGENSISVTDIKFWQKFVNELASFAAQDKETLVPSLHIFAGQLGKIRSTTKKPTITDYNTKKTNNLQTLLNFTINHLEHLLKGEGLTPDNVRSTENLLFICRVFIKYFIETKPEKVLYSLFPGTPIPSFPTHHQNPYLQLSLFN